MLKLTASPEGHVGYFDAAIIGQDSFKKYLNVLKRIPTRQWDKAKKVWHVGISDYDILRSDLEKAGLKHIDVSPDLSSLVSRYKKWEYETVEFTKQKDCAVEFDEKLIKLEMMPHQRVATQFMLRRRIALNGSEMGTGKTLTAIAAANHLHNTGQIKDCLVVCIASVKWNWAKEIAKSVDSKFIVIEGTQLKRARMYFDKQLFKIVNYEILRNDLDAILYEHKFDCIIVDEIHRIRTHNAKQTKALYELGKSAKYRFGLTGTPIQNKLNDLYSIMKFIHPDLLGDWFAFDQRYCMRGFFGEICDYQKLEEVHRKLKTVMFRRLKSEVLQDLPPKVYNDIYVEMGPTQKRFYKDAKDRLLKSDYEDVEEKIKQSNVLASIMYLREICDSTELIDPNTQESRKMEELKRIVPELIENGHKVVIFSQFEKMTRIIERDLKLPCLRLHGGISATGSERNNMIEEFTTSKTKNLFIMTSAGSEGINLQAADYIIFFDLLFNPSTIAQVEDRLHRKGQKSTVNVIKLIAKDTVEDRVLEIIKFKTDLFKKVVEGIDAGRQVTQREILKAL